MGSVKCLSLRWDLFAKTASTDGSKGGEGGDGARGAIGSNPNKYSQLLYRAEAVRPVTLAGRGRKIGFGGAPVRFGAKE